MATKIDYNKRAKGQSKREYAASILGGKKETYTKRLPTSYERKSSSSSSSRGSSATKSAPAASGGIFNTAMYTSLKGADAIYGTNYADTYKRSTQATDRAAATGSAKGAEWVSQGLDNYEKNKREKQEKNDTESSPYKAAYDAAMNKPLRPTTSIGNVTSSPKATENKTWQGRLLDIAVDPLNFSKYLGNQVGSALRPARKDWNITEMLGIPTAKANYDLLADDTTPLDPEIPTGSGQNGETYYNNYNPDESAFGSGSLTTDLRSPEVTTVNYEKPPATSSGTSDATVNRPDEDISWGNENWAQAGLDPSTLSEQGGGQSQADFLNESFNAFSQSIDRNRYQSDEAYRAQTDSILNAYQSLAMAGGQAATDRVNQLTGGNDVFSMPENPSSNFNFDNSGMAIQKGIGGRTVSQAGLARSSGSNSDPYSQYMKYIENSKSQQEKAFQDMLASLNPQYQQTEADYSAQLDKQMQEEIQGLVARQAAYGTADSEQRDQAQGRIYSDYAGRKQQYGRQLASDKMTAMNDIKLKMAQQLGAIDQNMADAYLKQMEYGDRQYQQNFENQLALKKLGLDSSSATQNDRLKMAAQVQDAASRWVAGGQHAYERSGGRENIAQQLAAMFGGNGTNYQNFVNTMLRPGWEQNYYQAPRSNSEQVTDPLTGKTYWVNPLTGEYSEFDPRG